jgi:hypothetical protein
MNVSACFSRSLLRSSRPASLSGGVCGILCHFRVLSCRTPDQFDEPAFGLFRYKKLDLLLHILGRGIFSIAGFAGVKRIFLK